MTSVGAEEATPPPALQTGPAIAKINAAASAAVAPSATRVLPASLVGLKLAQNFRRRKDDLADAAA
jgi:hypothetical protein